MKQPQQGLLLLDGGDALLARIDPSQEPAAAEVAKARVLMQAQGQMGLAAMAVGDVELSLGVERLQALAAEAQVPLLCANLRDAQDRAPFPGHKLVQSGGIKVGLIGLLDPPPTPQLEAVLKRAGVRLEDPRAAAKAAVAALQAAGAEVLIVLHHGGVPRARQLALEVPGPQLYLVGHSGYRLSDPQQTDGAFFFEAGRRGQALGLVQLRLGRGWRPGAQLQDDSRRHLLYQEIEGELKAASGRPARRPQPRQVAGDTFLRARELIKQLAAASAPEGPHTVIAGTLELDASVPEQPAIRDLVQQSRPAWNQPRLRAAHGAKLQQRSPRLRPPQLRSGMPTRPVGLSARDEVQQRPVLKTRPAQPDTPGGAASLAP